MFIIQPQYIYSSPGSFEMANSGDSCPKTDSGTLMNHVIKSLQTADKGQGLVNDDDDE